jgi:PhnB protein
METRMSIPETIPRIIPRLFCRDPEDEIEFCRNVFDATVQNRREGLDGKLVHGLIGIGPSLIMIESEWPQASNRAPELNGSTPVVVYVYVEDVDATVGKADALGARVLDPAQDQPWGDRTAWLMDLQGHVWTVASRVEEMSEDERRRRIAQRQRELSERKKEE